MDWKNLLGSLSESANDELRLRIEYLTAENRILRQQIKGRVRLSDSDRKDLGEIGRQLGRKVLSEIATVAQPDTILAWSHKFADKQVETAKPPKAVGRPRVDREIEDLVLRMARENRSWGYDRIQGALKHLGYVISDQTVGNILKRHNIPPAPERKKTVTWRECTRSHLDVLLATGFFTSEVWSWFGFMLSYVFDFIRISRDSVHSVGMILHHQGRWILPYGPRVFDVKAHVEKSRRSVPVAARLWLIYLGKRPQRPLLSKMTSDDHREGQSQSRGNVAFLSAVNPRPIRAGPAQCRQPISVLLQYDEEHKAA